MKKSTRLGVTILERRDVPAQFGVPWSDHQVTMSFVPDGTSVDGVTSNLYQFFSAAPSNWKDEILRAAQTWADQANLHISVVGDDGQPAGAPGAIQGDKRFGDIRIFGRPLSADVVAVTTPPGPAAGTRAGDIIINTSQNFTVDGSEGAFDLYSCMLQETGHAFGLDNSADILSPMYQWYQGMRTGLMPSDVDQIAALYGWRLNDTFDIANDNGQFNSATAVASTTVLLAGQDPKVHIEAELSSANDADYFAFTIPGNANGTIVVSLQTSEASLLKGRLTIFDADQVKVWESAAAGPLDGDLTAAIANIQAGETYYARIDRALGVNNFTVGQYRLKIDFSPAGPTLVDLDGDSVANDDHDNDLLGSATLLNAGLAHSGHYGITARFLDDLDIDTYEIAVPYSDATTILTATVNSLNPGMIPLLRIINADGAAVPFQTLHNANGIVALQAYVVAGQPVYLRAEADPAGSVMIGNYRLTANFKTAATYLTDFASGALTQSQPVIVEKLVVNRGSVMHFALMSKTASPSNDFGVQADVTDADGNVVMKFGAAAYTSATASKFLAPGSYIVRVGGKSRTPGATLPDMNVSLRIFNLSDPIGPRLETPDLPDPYWRGDRPADWSPWDIDLDLIF